MSTKGSTNIIVASGAAVIILGAGYLALTDRVDMPIFQEEQIITEDIVLVDETPEIEKTDYKKPPVSQSFDSKVHDVKYFYDNIQVPKEGEVRSGYKNRVVIRGKLVVIKREVLCITTPCPQPDPAFSRFLIENSQDFIQNEKYRIDIRNEGDPLAISLKEGEVYIFEGTLEHWFTDDDKVVFIFDPTRLR